ncbi:hypothetical protein D3C81_2068190 [compost metagenome]
MVPADQRLHPDHFAGNGVDLRLIMKHEFLTLQRRMQVLGDHRLLFQLLAQFPVEYKIIAVLQRFRLVHRHVGKLQQIVFI